MRSMQSFESAMRRVLATQCSSVWRGLLVYMAPDAYLADPHVQVGLVAADGGPLTWPLQISLLQTKEFAFFGTRIPAERALALGLANHVVADPLTEALAAAKKLSELPQKAVESTKRLVNIHLERAILASLDYAMTSEDLTFQSEDFRATIARLVR